MKILVVGDSMTAGHGLKHGRNDPKLWVNQFIEKYFKGADVTSFARSGVNNEWIFSTAQSEILRTEYDIVIIGWSELARLGMYLGLELYWTRTKFMADNDIKVNPAQIISKKWQDKVGNQLRKYNNDHWNILDLVKYVNTLIYTQEVTKKLKIYFVNTLMVFPKNYFERKTFSTPSDLSVFERTMLQSDTRDDTEIKELYDMIHDQYEYCGGIHKDNWLNLYDPFISIQVDNAGEYDRHPGYKSQDILLERLSATADHDKFIRQHRLDNGQC
jgi:hypothetical protein